MTSADRERLWELLADKATVGLTPPEEAELRALLDRFPEVDPHDLDRVAAQLELLNPAPQEALPPHLAAELERAALATPPLAAPLPSLFQPSTPPPASWLAAAGWLATAASLLMLVGLWYATRPAAPLTPEAALAKLLERDGTERWVGKGLRDEQPGLGGEVAWNQDTQQGYLRLDNLPINDPDQQQYQLWIVDGERDPKFPIDGGTFDVPRSGTVVVPIRTQLPVGKPVTFLVTREKAGGVVVSDRKDAWIVVVPPA